MARLHTQFLGKALMPALGLLALAGCTAKEAAPPPPAVDPSLSQSAGPWGNGFVASKPAYVATSSAAAPAAKPVSQSPGEPMTLTRNGSGQFHLRAMVNGTDAEFLVDTGADLVSLSTAEAERLQIRVYPADFRPILRTASGTANGAKVRIDRLEINGQLLQNVDAVVVEGLGLNLLGQSALRQLGKVELQGDRMVLHPA